LPYAMLSQIDPLNRTVSCKTDLIAQRLLRQLAHIDAVDLYDARGRIVKTRNKIDDGRLSGSCRPHQRNSGARLDMQIYIGQHWRVRAVREIHVLEVNRSFQARSDSRTRSIAHLVIGADNLLNPFVSHIGLGVGVHDF